VPIDSTVMYLVFPYPVKAICPLVPPPVITGKKKDLGLVSLSLKLISLGSFSVLILTGEAGQTASKS